MTKEQLLERNPWKDIAEQIKPNVTNCLYDNSNEYVIQGKEKDRIIAFNNALKNTDDSDKIVLQTPPEPWRGNPLTANLIILTLNPGYDLNINKTLACLIQAIDDVRMELINFVLSKINNKDGSFFNTKNNYWAAYQSTKKEGFTGYVNFGVSGSDAWQETEKADTSISAFVCAIHEF